MKAVSSSSLFCTVIQLTQKIREVCWIIRRSGSASSINTVPLMIYLLAFHLAAIPDIICSPKTAFLCTQMCTLDLFRHDSVFYGPSPTFISGLFVLCMLLRLPVLDLSCFYSGRLLVHISKILKLVFKSWSDWIYPALRQLLLLFHHISPDLHKILLSIILRSPLIFFFCSRNVTELKFSISEKKIV